MVKWGCGVCDGMIGMNAWMSCTSCMRRCVSTGMNWNVKGFRITIGEASAVNLCKKWRKRSVLPRRYRVVPNKVDKVWESDTICLLSYQSAKVKQCRAKAVWDCAQSWNEDPLEVPPKSTEMLFDVLSKRKPSGQSVLKAVQCLSTGSWRKLFSDLRMSESPTGGRIMSTRVMLSSLQTRLNWST